MTKRTGDAETVRQHSPSSDKPYPPGESFFTVFPRAMEYSRSGADAPGVRETDRAETLFPHTERHLQCLWYDARWRPAELRTTRGEAISVLSPGRWNLEAGPDFLDAEIRIASAHETLRGDVEIHIAPRDWNAHGHPSDRRYDRVVLHVTYFPGRSDTDDSDAHAPRHIVLSRALRRVPEFSFENIDITAYPYAALSRRHSPCADLLRKCNPAERIALLETAGQERLRRKTVRMRSLFAALGRHQTLYEETMAALGYKHNAAAFRSLARRLPVRALTDACANRPRDAYALLMGVAGLMPLDIPTQWTPEARRFVRELWDIWWRHEASFREVVMSPAAWRTSGMRPSNRPARRLAAAALLFARNPAFATTLLDARSDGPSVLATATDTLRDTTAFPFWPHRLSWNGKRLDRPVSLLGKRRAAAIVTNVGLPFAAAAGVDVAADLDALPAEEDNSMVRETAHVLFGHDHNPALYRTGLRQQGLLQIFQDFCIEAPADCSSCPLPDMLRHRV